MNEARCVVVRLPIRHLVNFLYRQPNAPLEVDIPSMNLPEGFKVITYQQGRGYSDCLLVLVYHESFEPVPEGQEYPMWPDPLTCVWNRYALATREEVLARPPIIWEDIDEPIEVPAQGN
jgi:hypothetical protein